MIPPSTVRAIASALSGGEPYPGFLDGLPPKNVCTGCTRALAAADGCIFCANREALREEYALAVRTLTPRSQAAARRTREAIVARLARRWWHIRA